MLIISHFGSSAPEASYCFLSEDAEEKCALDNLVVRFTVCIFENFLKPQAALAGWCSWLPKVCASAKVLSPIDSSIESSSPESSSLESSRKAFLRLDTADIGIPVAKKFGEREAC